MTDERWKHHRQHDHYDVESDMYIVLDSRVGEWEEGTPLHYVLQDLITRLISLESTTKRVFVFTLDAQISRRAFQLNAVIARTANPTFTLSAFVMRGGRFTIDAVIRGQGRFTLSALIV